MKKIPLVALLGAFTLGGLGLSSCQKQSAPTESPSSSETARPSSEESKSSSSETKQSSEVSTEESKSSSAEETKVTAITLSSEKKDIEIGEEISITAVVTPEEAKDKTLTWSVDHSDIATIDSTGKLKGVSAGTVIVTAKNAASNIEGSITINVLSPITKQKFEAENGMLFNCQAMDESSNEGYNASGNQHVGQWTNKSAILTYIDSPKQATAELSVTFALVQNDNFNELIHVSVNDEAIAVKSPTITSDITKGWWSWVTFSVGTVTLKEGVNQIRINGGSVSQTNVDYFELASKETLTVHAFQDDEAKDYYFYSYDAETSNCTSALEGDGNLTSVSPWRVGNLNVDSTITYKVHSETAQKADIKFNFSTPASVNMNALYSIVINGNAVTFADDFNATGKTGGWDSWSHVVLEDVDLVKGKNTITITAHTSQTNFEFVKFTAKSKIRAYDSTTDAVEGTAYYFEGEECETTGGINISTDSNARGGKSLGNVDSNTNATITAKFTSSASANSSIYVALALPTEWRENICKLTLNGTELAVPSAYHHTNPGWSNYQEFKLADAILAEGDNTLVFTVTGGAGNFDYFKVVTPATLNGVSK